MGIPEAQPEISRSPRYSGVLVLVTGCGCALVYCPKDLASTVPSTVPSVIKAISNYKRTHSLHCSSFFWLGSYKETPKRNCNGGYR